jgi:hypothetical protein
MSHLTATVSGSFHRHLHAIMEAVEELHACRVRVLSPEDPRVVDAIDSFLFVASDRHRSIRLVQDRHLASIGQSDFLWLVNPDGYIGQSASLEIGFAIACGVPILSTNVPPDLTMREYVKEVPGVKEAVQFVSSGSKSLRCELTPSLLVEPATAVEFAHRELDEAAQLLVSGSRVGTEIKERFKSHQRNLARCLSLPH